MSTPRLRPRLCVARSCHASPRYLTVGAFGNPLGMCARHLAHACASGAIRDEDGVTIARADGTRVERDVVVAWWKARQAQQKE